MTNREAPRTCFGNGFPPFGSAVFEKSRFALYFFRPTASTYPRITRMKRILLRMTERYYASAGSGSPAGERGKRRGTMFSPKFANFSLGRTFIVALEPERTPLH